MKLTKPTSWCQFATNADEQKDPSRLIVSFMPGENVIVPRGMTTKLADYKSPSGKEGEFLEHALRGRFRARCSYIGLQIIMNG